MLTLQRLNPLTDPSWDAHLSTFPEATLFHSSAWTRVLCDTYHYDPTYLLLGSSTPSTLDPLDPPRALLPLMGISSWLTGRRGVSLPFTDECAPLASDPAALAPLIAAARTHAHSQGWKYLEFRGGQAHFSRQPAWQPATSFWSHHLPLSPDEPALLARFESSTRRAIRKAEQQNLEIETSTSRVAMEAFYRLVCLTRQRHGLPPQPWLFFENLQKHLLAPGKGCIILARTGQSARDLSPQSTQRSNPSAQSDPPSVPSVPSPCPPCPPAGPVGSPIAGAIYLHSGKTVHYKYGASDDTQQHLRANNLVMWRAITWHAQRGFTSLDFGRTSLYNEGLRRFKLGWGTTESRLDYTRLDPATGRYLSCPDRATGWHSHLFRRVPPSLSRFLGRLLYRHVA